MQATFLGYLDHATGNREPRFGFTVGKAYNIAPCTADGSTVWVLDDDGATRSRPATDFQPVSWLRRAWARFPSLQRVFA